ncbi:MAG: hypothetical protein A2X64_00580 [Ignavibacteria bacterium GWF2_33_9]|nr:MAG: hypothetical protein A2X64_00580 [Ignavibacteria bacterium GWF2_33_9]
MLSNSNLFSQDSPPINIKTPAPCLGRGTINYHYGGYDSYIIPDWSTEPNYKKICSDDFLPADESLGHCCYWIVYHDRLKTLYDLNQNPFYVYETNVTAIIYEGEGCKKRTQGEIIQNFQRILYNEVRTEHPEYAPWGAPDGGAFEYNGQYLGTFFVFYSTGRCLDSLNQLCNNYTHTYCCQSNKFLYLESDNSLNIDSLVLVWNKYQKQDTVYYMGDEWDGTDSTYNENFVPCNCISFCDNIMFAPNQDRLCYPPCDDAKWEVPEDSPLPVPIPNCPNCFVNVAYKYRETYPCPEYEEATFNDISIDEIEIDSLSPCNQCNLNVFAIHNAVVDYLLKNAFNNYPQPGDSNTHYRIFKASCWSDFFDPGWYQYFKDDNNQIDSVWYPSVRVLKDCGPSNCCWQRYTISTDFDPPYEKTYTIIDSGGSIEPCYIRPYPCTFICEPE